VKIIVSSTAIQKLQAVQKAFEIQLPNITLEIKGLKVPSGINEQPVRKKEIEQGCNNRLAETMKLEQSDIFISMENGIVKEGENWIDIGYIIMYFQKSRQQFDGYTNSVIFPTDCVEEAKKRGFELNTVGSVMAELYPQINKQDPHLSISGKSRVFYLSRKIEDLISQANKLYMFHRMK
jgi:non-canonical (house-cleaning) NTP pyrophosphatase